MSAFYFIHKLILRRLYKADYLNILHQINLNQEGELNYQY